MTATHPHLVEILQTVQAYPRGTYELPVLGFGETTRERAEAEAVRQCALYRARGATVRAVFQTACGTCGARGIKPGCKRKACETCGGKGVFAA